jgi:chromosome segregation ATPase
MKSSACLPPVFPSAPSASASRISHAKAAPPSPDSDSVFLTGTRADIDRLLRDKAALESSIASLAEQRQSLESAISNRQQEIALLDRRYGELWRRGHKMPGFLTPDHSLIARPPSSDSALLKRRSHAARGDTEPFDAMERQRSLLALQEKLTVIASQKKEIGRLNQSIAALEAEIHRRDEAEVTNASRLERIRRLKEIDAAPAPVTGKKGVMIAELNAVISDQKRQIQNFETSVANLKKTICGQKHCIEIRDNTVADLENVITVLRKSDPEALKQKADEVLRKENEELRRQLSKVRDSEAMLQQQMDELMGTISARADAHEKAHANLCQAASGMEATLAETRAREQALLTEKFALQAALSKACAKANEWASRGAVVLARISNFEGDIERLREAVASFKTKVSR